MRTLKAGTYEAKPEKPITKLCLDLIGLFLCKIRYTNIAKALLYTIALGGHSLWKKPKNIL